MLAAGARPDGQRDLRRFVIEKNAGFVAVPGDTIGKWQPSIPRWRATASASYRFDPDLSASVGARYSGKQYRTLDNSDVNGFTYMGVSSYFTTDLRLRWQPARQWTVAPSASTTSTTTSTGTSIPTRSEATAPS